MINEHDINDWEWFWVVPIGKVKDGLMVSLPGESVRYYVKGRDHLKNYVRMYSINDESFSVPIFIDSNTVVEVYVKRSNH